MFATMVMTSPTVGALVVFLGVNEAIMPDSLATTPAMLKRDRAAKIDLIHFCRKARPDA
jgi:hypothetical protein